MVRSLSTAKLFASLFIINRRGYGAASRGSVCRAASPDKEGYNAQVHDSKLEEKDPAKVGGKSGSLSSWAPDPVTGFYKPCNSVADTDAAELREMVFNHSKLKAQN